MENDSAFLPVTQTYAIAAASTPPTAILMGPAIGSQITAKIYNSGTVLASVSFASTAALAASQCVTPTSGTPQTVLVLAPGEDGTFTVSPGQFWTATAASASTVYVQFGYGI